MGLIGEYFAAQHFSGRKAKYKSYIHPERVRYSQNIWVITNWTQMRPQATAINTDNSREIFTSMEVATTNTQKMCNASNTKPNLTFYLFHSVVCNRIILVCNRIILFTDERHTACVKALNNSDDIIMTITATACDGCTRCKYHHVLLCISQIHTEEQDNIT